MSDWDKIRLCTVHNDVNNNLEVLKLDLLRLGYLIKNNLGKEYCECISRVGYHLGEEVDDVSVILYFDRKKCSHINSVEVVMSIKSILECSVDIVLDDIDDLVLFVRVYNELV